MISVRWDQNRCQKGIELPSGWIFFCFRKADEPLWCGYTPNLAQRLNIIRQKAENDSQYGEASALADTLQFESYPRSMDALIRYKAFVHEHHPPYQQALSLSRDYVYLALDAYRFPFACTRSDTQDDWTYLGPWRSRFFLSDVMDSVARILKLPFCETGSFPCEKLDNGLCKGYCQALSEDSSQEEKDNLAKLDALLRDAYVHPNNGILEMVQQERDNYFNELEFAKADLLDDEIANLAKYRDWLNFLYVTKSLSFSEENLRVENGMLAWCRLDGREYSFPTPHVEYRDNEQLAINLTDADEARLIYEYYVKHHKG
jgi:excinuclease UvrABC nuclease subunit